MQVLVWGAGCTDYLVMHLRNDTRLVLKIDEVTDCERHEWRRVGHAQDDLAIDCADRDRDFVLHVIPHRVAASPEDRWWWWQAASRRSADCAFG